MAEGARDGGDPDGPSGERRRRARSFGITVLAGLVGAGLAAVAGTRTWAESRGDAAGIRVTASVTGSDAAPLAAALALVALAAWGVVLATRGRVRRLVAVVGLVASLGAAVAVVAGFGDVAAAAREAAVAQGATGEVTVGGLSGWYYATALGAMLAAACFGVAVAHAPRWPAMGAKYDAPASRRQQPDPADASEEDLWRAMDDGRDPTS